MRLHLKMLVMIATTAAAQWVVEDTRRSGHLANLWFAARCQYAAVTSDDAMRERLA